jgi:hypothetical protein
MPFELGLFTERYHYNLEDKKNLLYEFAQTLHTHSYFPSQLGHTMSMCHLNVRNNILTRQSVL